MADYTELKRLVDRVRTDRRFCGDENHKALADGVLALIAENARLAADHDLLMSNALPRAFLKLCADYERLDGALEFKAIDAKNYREASERCQAENEALRKALMYVRDNADDWHLSEKAADALVDAALSKGEQP